MWWDVCRGCAQLFKRCRQYRWKLKSCLFKKRLRYLFPKCLAAPKSAKWAAKPAVLVIRKPTIIWNGTVLQSVMSGSLQMSTLDTNGNNGVVSIIMMDVELCIKWQLFALWETCVYIGMFAVLPNTPRCLKDRDSTSLWACVYVLHLKQCMSFVHKRKCKRSINCSGLVELVAWKLFYCVSHCVLKSFSVYLIEKYS